MPQTTTGISPAKLLLNRQPRTRLDLLRPNTPLRVEERQLAQKQTHDVRARSRSFHIGDLVYVKNCIPGPQWISGEVIGVAENLCVCVIIVVLLFWCMYS